MADRIASVKNAVNAAEIAIRRAEVSAELSKKAATDALDVQLVTICEASHLLPSKAPVTSKSENDNTIDIRWLLFVVFVSAVACGFAISFGYTMWPSINEGCQPYNCSWAPWSYCSNGTCQYFWLTIVDGQSSWWDWGTTLGGCGGACSNTANVYTTNNTKDQPYPNGTLCYEPSYCNPAPNRPWIQGWNCLPVFNCTNTVRIIGRLWFVCTTSIVLGIVHVIAMLWLYCDHRQK